MTDKKSNLNDFFKKETKKKPANKPKAGAASESAAQAEASKDLPQVDNKEQDKQVAKDTAKKANYDDSSEEEKDDIIIGKDSAAVIKDRKEVDAENRKKKQQQEQESGASGWKALEKQSIDRPGGFTGSKGNAPRGVVPMGTAATEDAGSKSINFSKKGPPTFSKQSKGNVKKLDEDFPEIGAEMQQPSKGGARESDAPTSKKDNANIGMFGSGGVGPRSGAPREEQPEQEERKPLSKPVFTSSKKKAFVGGDNVDTIQSSKQNYDFSGMRMAGATDKVSKGPQGEMTEDGQPRERKQYRFEEDDFVTVKEKVRKVPGPSNQDE